RSGAWRSRAVTGFRSSSGSAATGSAGSTPRRTPRAGWSAAGGRSSPASATNCSISSAKKARRARAAADDDDGGGRMKVERSGNAAYVVTFEDEAELRHEEKTNLAVGGLFLKQADAMPLFAVVELTLRLAGGGEARR